jgi:hypothetical protein
LGEKRNVYKLLVGKPEGKRPLGKLRCRWVDDIMRGLGEIGMGGVDWISLTQDRFHKMLGNYQMAIQLVASQAELCSAELVCSLHYKHYN